MRFLKLAGPTLCAISLSSFMIISANAATGKYHSVKHHYHHHHAAKGKNRRQALRGRRARSEARVATMAALFVCGGCLSTPSASPHLPQEPRERLRTPPVDRK